MEEDIREEILDSPLVVHKADDASYQETAAEGGMQTTHIDDDSDVPTLERHRFKKVKKKKKWPYVLLALIVVAAVVIAVLIGNGTISFGEKKTTTKAKVTYATTAENPFKDTITVKGTYLFFEGNELDDIGELERKVKYLDAGTKFVIQDENADSNFLNFEVLSLLSNYGMEYEITHIVSSGLTSKYETTAAPETTTAAPTQAESTAASQPSE
ncbi:MAG: hypothetical protein PUE08_05630 [Eubacteriales bacterium]|nr:hypothetical protein [Eubacteriales bacterium]